MPILSELRRRNVFRVAALYLVAGWVLLQVAELLFGALDVPEWSLRLLLGLLLLGLPLAVIFAWVYELTPQADQLAQIAAQRGELDEAIRWLDVARRVRDPGVFKSGVDQLLDPLRDDPRFKTYLRELKLPGG